MKDYTAIIEIIISLLSAVITVFIIPILKQKLTQEKQEKLIFWIQTAVTAAIQDEAPILYIKRCSSS